MANQVKKRKRPRIYEIDETNDYKFHGIFSYRHLRILGWAFMALAQFGIILSLFAGKTDNAALSTTANVFNFFASLMAPLFLLAAFAQVLTAKDGYKKLILLYVGAVIGIYLVFLLIYFHFLVGTIAVVTGTPEGASNKAAGILSLLSGAGFFAFNIFVDLALCALTTFFLNYHPTRFFQGKWHYLFRSFAILPILYEIGSIVLKMLAATDGFQLSPFLYPLLTAKPPATFLIFVALALYVKLRERSFLKHGKTLDDYRRFLDSNANRVQFSRFLILAIIVAVVIDFIAAVLASSLVYSSYEGQLPEDLAVSGAIMTVSSWGLGNTIPMLLTIPIVAFFDYRKTYKNKLVDTAIPVIGVAIIAIIYIEGFFQFGKFMISQTFPNGIMGSGDEAEEEGLLLSAIRFLRE